MKNDQNKPATRDASKPIPKLDKELLITKLVSLRVKKGYSRQKLVEFTMLNYPVKRRMAYKIVKLAFERIGQAYNEMLGDALADSIQFMENLKEIAMEEKNYIRALDVQKELNKINQLYIQRQEVTIRAEQPLFKEEDENNTV